MSFMSSHIYALADLIAVMLSSLPVRCPFNFLKVCLELIDGHVDFLNKLHQFHRDLEDPIATAPDDFVYPFPKSRATFIKVLPH